LEHLIIGTAGHVDHGKTVLVKALTGVDTDRLQEEKERGISIDLGFAPFRLPGGRLAGVVDVPGHERFIHNMLAGASGMDLVLLVVDANEGVMPQTREHLNILQLLGVQKGIVVITKIDLVDEQWRELVEEEIREELKGTFLEEAPVQSVSALSGLGIDPLKELIDRVTGEVRPRDAGGPLRLPLDRAFTIVGFGTVITGTILQGTVRVGDTIEVVPPGTEARVRNIQVHDQDVKEARAGQRVALNLSGTEKEQLTRGAVVSSPNCYRTSALIDVKLTLLPGAPRPVKNMDPAHFFLGAARTVARLLLLECDEIKPGGKAFVQCRLERPLVAERGDPFIIRSYSPMTTIGGGVVLDPAPERHRRFRRPVIQHLSELEQDQAAGGDEAFVLRKLEELFTADLPKLAQATRLGREQLAEIMAALRLKGVVDLLDSSFVARASLLDWERKLADRLEKYHRQFPLSAGISRAELRAALPAAVSLREYDALLTRLTADKITACGDSVSLCNFKPNPPPEVKAQLEQLARIYEQAGLQPPSSRDAGERAGVDGRRQEEFFAYLVSSGILVKISEDLYFHNSAYQEAAGLLRRHFQSAETMTLAQFRDISGSSRKYIQALLEHFDQIRLTRRVGDHRVLRGEK
jgi:selenocysteine-specific elongation factor